MGHLFVQAIRNESDFVTGPVKFRGFRSCIFFDIFSGEPVRKDTGFRFCRNVSELESNIPLFMELLFSRQYLG